MDWKYKYEQPPHNEHTSVQQGVTHVEPNLEDFNAIKQLFGFRGGVLDVHDVKYVELEPRPIDISYSLEADDRAVLKLTPNTQLTFPGFDDE